jgi:N-acetylglucosamine malate deacetylase 1
MPSLGRSNSFIPRIWRLGPCVEVDAAAVYAMAALTHLASKVRRRYRARGHIEEHTQRAIDRRIKVGCYMKTALINTLRGLHDLIVPGGMRHALKSLLSRDGRYWPTQVTDFSADPVLVLAPHMDDEILGCGGALRKHVLSGARVTVVYMTDGRKGGDPGFYRCGLTEEVLENFESALVVQRKEEARRAAEIVGIQNQIFLDHPDGRLKVSHQAVDQLQAILQQDKPTVIYLPSILDIHPDHRATNRILYAATKNFSSGNHPAPVYREYEVWTPVLSNRIIDISDVVETKHKAIEQFSSQIAQTNYLRTQLALNAYRSVYSSQGSGYAEAFFESSAEQHRSLLRRFLNEPAAK